MASSAALTMIHLPRLRVILDEWRAAQPPANGFATSLQDVKGKDLKDVIVAFRTRPPLPNEAAEKFQAEGGAEEEAAPIEFCSGITITSAEPGVFVTHTPGMNVSMEGPNLGHKTFKADLAFGPGIDNEEVYQRTVIASDLLPLVLGGGVGCVLAYGQTGSGKTYTMEALEHCIARDLFAVATEFAQTTYASENRLSHDAEDVSKLTANDAFIFEVTFLELLSKAAVDLVEVPTEHDDQGHPIRKEVAIQEDRVGNVNPKLISTQVTSSDELEKLIVNSLSTVVLTNPYADEGQLVLVDLAGSERYEDSKAHDKQRMDESRENNKSLMNLKECDCAHSASTLGYAAPFKTAPPKPKGPAKYDPTDPRTWTHDDTPRRHPPAGMLATHFGRLPTADFANRVLAARKDVPAHAWTADEIKEYAATVAGSLWHLLITAKTRKRNAVMKSRNVLDKDIHYDVAPEGQTYDNSNDLGVDWTDDEFVDAQIYHDNAWSTRIREGMQAVSGKGHADHRRAYNNQQAILILEYREAKKNQENGAAALAGQ
ncbi:P-loop containing nucleoside triphosphate hydrolase protein [Auriculariales sp. MPI-PUGE-AT-0066]|nr:P-loop containing nucleoside triphosphate hydrolase protein [Auriculariales sp. MPI-PUGE-AT-0066]